MKKYRPLPEGLTIQPSKIEGLGLFTLKDIQSGLNLGISHVENSRDQYVLRTPLGGFINHSETPNLRKLKVGINYYLITNVDIPMGTELTLKYEWYEPEGDVDQIQSEGS